MSNNSANKNTNGPVEIYLDALKREARVALTSLLEEEDQTNKKPGYYRFIEELMPNGKQFIDELTMLMRPTQY